ncbi:MAG: SDR family oxidoreductase [Rhodospirillales bacterium]|nr:SDR family oxidoreductase [Rhodospirillales bacterium]
MTDISLGGKATIVSGAGSGLGQTMALALAGAGANVLIADNREGAIAATLDAAPNDGVRARLAGYVADVAFEGERIKIADACVREFGRIDALINNAGIGQDTIREDYATNPIRPWEVEAKHLEKFFAVHTIAPLRLAAAVLPAMIAQGKGRIITVTTSLTTMTRGNMTAYGGAKAASEAYMAGLSEELARDVDTAGITVNILVPGGAADTPMVPDRPGLDRRTLTPPWVMAAPVIWLVSDLSDGITARRFIGKDWDPKAPLEDAINSAGAPIGWNG